MHPTTPVPASLRDRLCHWRLLTLHSPEAAATTSERVLAVLAGALVLALLGAMLGAAVAWLFLGGNRIAIGVGAACAVGVLGGLFPALRAARGPVAAALRSS
jgi:hypothetical protein